MQRFLLTILLAVSLVGFVKAQETTVRSADTTERAKKEVLKYEHDLVQALLKGGSTAADFIDRVDATGEVLTINGVAHTKANLVAAWRSGDRKQLVVDHHGFHVHVYGTTAVVTYSGHDHTEIRGKISDSYFNTTDVLIKQQGMWRRVVHNVNYVPVKGAK